MTVVEFQLHYIPLALGTTALFEIFLLTCVQLLQQNGFFTSKDLFESSSVILVSAYCQSGISTLVSKSESTASFPVKLTVLLLGND